MSQKSFQPRAMAYVASSEPTKIQASHQKYHQGAGHPAPMISNTQCMTTTPAPQAMT